MGLQHGESVDISEISGLYVVDYDDRVKLSYYDGKEYDNGGSHKFFYKSEFKKDHTIRAFSFAIHEILKECRKAA